MNIDLSALGKHLLVTLDSSKELNESIISLSYYLVRNQTKMGEDDWLRALQYSWCASSSPPGWMAASRCTSSRNRWQIWWEGKFDRQCSWLQCGTMTCWSPTFCWLSSDSLSSLWASTAQAGLRNIPNPCQQEVFSVQNGHLYTVLIRAKFGGRDVDIIYAWPLRVNRPYYWRSTVHHHPRNTTTMPTSGFMERSLAALAELVREGGGPEVDDDGRGGGWWLLRRWTREFLLTELSGTSSDSCGVHSYMTSQRLSSCNV